jgi:hypothetical protein
MSGSTLLLIVRCIPYSFLLCSISKLSLRICCSIFTYTSDQATEDGILFDLDLMRQYCTRGSSSPLKYVTTNLLSKGYWNQDETLNIPNMIDLITQSLKIFAKKPRDDWFVSGVIELPSGAKQKIFIAQNETGRYTAMLPEDY